MMIRAWIAGCLVVGGAAVGANVSNSGDVAFLAGENFINSENSSNGSAN